MVKVYVIMKSVYDSNTHESYSSPVLVCSSMFKASLMKKKFELSSCNGLFDIKEVEFD